MVRRPSPFSGQSPSPPSISPSPPSSGPHPSWPEASLSHYWPVFCFTRTEESEWEKAPSSWSWFFFYFILFFWFLSVTQSTSAGLFPLLQLDPWGPPLLSINRVWILSSSQDPCKVPPGRKDFGTIALKEGSPKSPVFHTHYIEEAERATRLPKVRQQVNGTTGSSWAPVKVSSVLTSSGAAGSRTSWGQKCQALPS